MGVFNWSSGLVRLSASSSRSILCRAVAREVQAVRNEEFTLLTISNAWADLPVFRGEHHCPPQTLLSTIFTFVHAVGRSFMQ